jgi:transcriptional regulator with XRE-family HTH domain
VSAPPPTRKHLGRAIRRKRLALELTIEDLADVSKMHHTYLSGIERGLRNPTWQKLQDLATGLGTPLSAIVLEAENEAKLAQTAATSESAPSDR